MILIKQYYYLLSILLIVSLNSCDEDNHLNPLNESYQYLHLGHTRTDSNPKMDSLIEVIDYSKYDMLWLGGDLAYLTSEDDETMKHIDSIFNLSSPSTLWTLGNHDYSNLTRIKRYTRREAHYSINMNGITFLVLDTQDSLSNITDEQLEMFKSVVDTIQESSHLIILTHKLIWMAGHSHLEQKINEVSNGYFGDCNYCVNPNNFYSDIYPELVKIKGKGISVICIAGDIGVNSKEFEFQTSEGIIFLASGIKSGKSGNKALLFTHDMISRKLLWEFKLLEDL